ncbi:MAG: DUF2242 domain-containing protein [Rhodocyclaceae bacterium]|nr:MAG: DUF2242 domain-containing protein [Rhodocyclaceae bacterium]
MSSLRAAAVVLAVAALAGCGGEKTYHHDERFAVDPRHKHEFAASRVALCDAARHVLLAQGYLVSRGEEGGDVVLLGQKEFKEKDNRTAVLQVQAVCGDKGKGSALFVTALESHFAVAQTKEKTSLGLPLVAPISITSTTTLEGQLKCSGETVDDRAFYDALFRAVERELASP